MQSARIYAQDAIRIKTTGTNYLRLSSRLDAVASRVESAVKMQQVTKQMGQVTKGMDKVLASMDINQISKVMDKFEAQFDDMEVKSQYAENAMNSATASSTPEDEVESLMQQVADTHALDFKARTADAGTAPVQAQQAQQNDQEEDALEK